MSPDYRRRLDDLGFVWDPLEAIWDEGYRQLIIYLKRTGNCRVPQTHIESDFPLGQWVNNQRAKKHSLSRERRRRLDELGFLWDSRQSDWDEGYAHLKLFKEREAHCRVPIKYKDGDGYLLGQWVNNQRARKDSLTDSRRKKLNDIGFVWDPFDEDWEIGFSHLTRFRELEGHCRVPLTYKVEDDGFRLGQWVGVQRQSKARMSKDRVRRLDQLGFIWDSRQSDWDEGYARLKIYKEREGHCRVPVKYTDADGFRLGQWVFDQRQNRENLSEDRLQKLRKLGFDWDPLETAWMEGFQHLKSFKKREGHYRVPAAHHEEGYPLGRWVNRQRTAKNRMSHEHRRLLDELGFVWNVR